jgi:hypothetical protein
VRARADPGERLPTAAMDDKRFKEAVEITGRGGVIAVHSARQALDLLVDPDWPMRGPRHRDATDACLKVLEGYRSTEDARVAFIDAANEASIAA